MAEQNPSQSDSANAEVPHDRAVPPSDVDSSPETGDASNPEAAAEQALDSAERAAETIKAETNPSPAAEAAREGEQLNLEEFSPHDVDQIAAGLNLLDDIDLNVKVELGRTLMYIEDVLRLNENSVIELDKAAGDPVDIFVNDRHVARGEVLVLNENFCVRISEIIKDEEDPAVSSNGSHAGNKKRSLKNGQNEVGDETN